MKEGQNGDIEDAILAQTIDKKGRVKEGKLYGGERYSYEVTTTGGDVRVR